MLRRIKQLAKQVHGLKDARPFTQSIELSFGEFETSTFIKSQLGRDRYFMANDG